MAEMPESVVVFVTAPAREAGRIATTLVEKRLASCVSAAKDVYSVFWWQGSIDSAQETLLIIKTRPSLLPRLIAAVKKEHSYSVPEIIALPIVGGNAEYLDWIRAETASPQE